MSTARTARRQGTVLVAEEDADIAEFVRAVLEDAGYAAPVLGAADGATVRVTVGQLEPDCVLLDAGHPAAVDPGARWRDAAWAHAQRRAVPVILFTASVRDAEEARTGESERSRAAGFFAAVVKPFELDVLLAAVEQAAGSVARFDRSAAAEQRRTDILVAKLEAAGAQDINPGTRREWAAFYAGYAGGALTLLYWSQRDGVYFVLQQPAAGGAVAQVGRFHDLDAAVAGAMAD